MDVVFIQHFFFPAMNWMLLWFVIVGDSVSHHFFSLIALMLWDFLANTYFTTRAHPSVSVGKHKTRGKSRSRFFSVPQARAQAQDYGRPMGLDASRCWCCCRDGFRRRTNERVPIARDYFVGSLPHGCQSFDRSLVYLSQSCLLQMCINIRL